MKNGNHIDKNKVYEPSQVARGKYFESITHAELNEYLYRNLIVGVIPIFIVASILFLELSNVVEAEKLIFWYGLVLSVLAFRIGVLFWYSKTKQEIKLQNYHYNFFILGSTLSAALWGILGSYLMPATVLHQAFIIVMVLTVVAGSAISLGVRYSASILYIFFSLVPILFWEVLQVLKGSRGYLGVVIAMTLYLIYSAITAYRNSNVLRNSIALKNQNIYLLDSLNEHLRKMELFSEMGESLDKCRNDQEIGEICKKYIKDVFPEFSGAILLLPETKTQLEPLAAWGYFSLNEEKLVFPKEECLASTSKNFHISHGAERCKHCPGSSEFYVCVPLQTPLKYYGILYLKLNPKISFQQENIILSQKAFITRIATNISFALNTVQEQRRLQSEAIHDKLTGLYNRRYLDDYFKMEIARYERNPIPIAIIMIDIDYFKKYNDQYGHDLGDEVLRELGALLKERVRGSDFACRFGGEEFILVLPESDVEVACERAESIREEVKHIKIVKDGKTISGITISLGVSVFHKHGDTQANVIKAADKALYRAKTEGRDKVCIADQ